MNIALLFAVSLFSPLPLWLIQQPLPYPHLIEEIFKLIILRLAPKFNKFWHPLLLALAFSFSESFFYLTNFFQLGNFNLFLPRLFLTSLLHLSTFSLLYYSRHFWYFSLPALIFSITLHYFYNQTLVPLLLP